MITGATKELLEQEVKPIVVAFLRERGLELSQEKTVITHIADGFDFLGQVRHEVAQAAVTTEQSGRNLAFYRQYPTKTCGRSNPAV